MTTDTFYPGLISDPTTTDGNALRQAADISWDNLQGGVGTSGTPHPSSLVFQLRSDGGSSDWFRMYRIFINFDTNTLPKGINISAATVRVWGELKDNGLGISPALNVFSSSSAFNSTVVAADYDKVGDTPFATAIAYADWTASAWNDFELNAAGIAAIVSGGVTNFSIRESNYDAPDIAPPWSSNLECNMWMAGTGGGAGHRARLIVTYGANFPSSTVVRVTGIRRIYRPGVYRMLLSLGEISDMGDIAGHRDYVGPDPFDPKTWLDPLLWDIPLKEADRIKRERNREDEDGRRSPILPPDEPTMPQPERIPRTGRAAVPFAGDDPERQPLWKPRRRLPFPAPPPSFEPKVVLSAPKVFKETVIDPIVDFVKSFFSSWGW